MAVYLIGGPPKSGKTSLAKRMSKERGIPWISSDTLENIVWAYTPKEQHAILFARSYLRGESNDIFYSQYTAEEIVKGYVEQSKATYDAISMIAETYLTDKDDFIVEGYQVTPEVVSRILKKFGSEHIRTAFLLKRDEEKMLQDFHKSTTPNDWILRKTKDEATFAKIARMIAVYSDYIEREAKKYDLPLFEMDADFDASLESAMKHLTNG
jgi:2-phosphoglycerate kinase